MTLIEKAEEYIREFCWSFDDSEDKMWSLVVRQESIMEVDVFFYGPLADYELEGEYRRPYLIAGNAPLLYDPASGGFLVTGTALRTEEYVKRYILFDNPHYMPSSEVEMTGWKSGARKVSATKAIRSHTRYGLKEAKECVDTVLEREPVVITALDSKTATELVAELNKLGFLAKQKGKPFSK